MRKIVCLFITIILINFPMQKIYANQSTNENNSESQTLTEQQEEFGINDFIQESKQYTGDFFEDIDINKILQDALKGEINNDTIINKILNLLGKEFTSALGAIAGILAIIIIHSILKSISDGLENDNISKIIYYVQYILIITIIMSNFSDIVKIVQDTSNNLVGFMNILVPLLMTLMIYTGSIATTTILEPITLFLINFIGNIIQTILIPLVLVVVSLVIISKISDKVQIGKIAKFLKSGIVWFLGIILTVFVAMVSLEGTLSSSVDGITAKTTKAVVSSAIPVVGKILGDAVDTVLGCGIILKNAVGFVGVIIVVGICIIPILKLTILTIAYKILSAVTEPIADSKIVDLLEQIGDIFKIFLAILCSLSVLLIIGTALVVKISNTGMMYR